MEHQPEYQDKPYLIREWLVIAGVVGVSKSTLYRWHHAEGFPICRLPDGRVATTRGLIDAWVMARQAEHAQAA